MRALDKESLTYSTRIAFLERAVVEPVYNFDEKSTASVQKGESTAKVPFKPLGVTYIYIRMDTSPNHITPCPCMGSNYFF